MLTIVTNTPNAAKPMQAAYLGREMKHLHQWFSTGATQNPGVLPVQYSGSASLQLALGSSKLVMHRVPRVSGMFHKNYAQTER